MIIDRLKVVFFILMGVVLTGCTSIQPDRTGTNIDIYPVTYSLSLTILEGNTENAKEKVESFFEEYKASLLVQTIKLEWSDKNSEEFADMVYMELINKGINSEKIVRNNRLSLVGNSRFNFKVAVTNHVVANKNCEKAKIQRYFIDDEGCFVDHARWKSLVAPERMLPNLNKIKE